MGTDDQRPKARISMTLTDILILGLFMIITLLVMYSAYTYIEKERNENNIDLVGRDIGNKPNGED